MVNLYLTDVLARERVAEIERRARRFGELHPISEQWDDPVESPLRTEPAPGVLRSESHRLATGRRGAPEVSLLSLEAWRMRRACRVRRRGPTPSRRDRIAEGRD